MGIVDRYCFNGTEKFNIKKFDTDDIGEFETREEAVEEFVNNLKEINEYQQKLYAERKEGVIFVFQAMDAAGKDGVIRTVFSTLSPHGVREYCFKAPSTEELNHDFLWRFWSALPARGSISIFNRSYYEDVLVGKVHKLYKNQILPKRVKDQDIIEMRYHQICDYEKYLYHTGTRIVKIFLNVSKDEQGKRFISRIDTPKKNWKISSGDIEERKYWDDYMEAFETMVNVTSTKLSPWYVVPANHKWYARLIVSRIILNTLKEIDPHYPPVENEENLQALRKEIYDSLKDKNLEIEQENKIFSTPSTLVQDAIAKEEHKKINEKKIKTRDSGFEAVREMLQRGTVLKSQADIINAVAHANEKALKPSSAYERAKEREKDIAKGKEK